MSKNQFTGTATQPQCNRKFCQFNKDQYCKSICVAIGTYFLKDKIFRLFDIVHDQTEENQIKGLFVDIGQKVC